MDRIWVMAYKTGYIQKCIIQYVKSFIVIVISNLYILSKFNVGKLKENDSTYMEELSYPTFTS